METNFDLIVLGAGPGGYVAAIRASQLGLKTAVVEKKNVGGVCLNIGCIPSKNLISSASIFSSMKQLEAFGVSTDASKFDYASVHAQSRKVADTLSKGVNYLLDKNGVTVVNEEGFITSANQVTTKSGVVLTGKNILVATGSRPRIIPGLEFDSKQVMSSDDILMSNTLPKSLCIIGGGAIGCEFAYVMRSFNVEVTIVEMTSHLLPYEDEEVAKSLATSFKKKGISVHLSSKATIVSKDDNSVSVEIESEKGTKKTIAVEKVLAVVGRVPNTSGIGLEELAIELQRGFIPVNEHYQTSVPSIFAIGDVINTPMLAHVASKEGELAVEFMAGKSEGEENFYNFIPNCVYSEPQVAGFGLTEAKAKEKDPESRAFSVPFRAIGKAVAINKSEGFVKIVTDGVGNITGAHIIGADATEMIHELALAASKGIKIQDIGKMVHAHPTMSEGIMESARGFDNWIIHV